MAATIQQKTKGVLLYAKLNSVVLIQREFKQLYGTRKAPTSQSILYCFRQFEEAGTVTHQKGAGRPCMPADAVDKIQTAMTRSLKIFAKVIT